MLARLLSRRSPMRLEGPRDDAGQARRLPSGKDPSPAPTVVSFDVFDTVLVRAVGSSHAVFLLLGRQLVRRGLVACSAEAFARDRLAADRRAFRNAGGRDSETGLADIYRELPVIRMQAPHILERVIGLELAMEARLLQPLPHVTDLLDAWRASGTRVIFVSDTYLPQAFIEEQLRNNGLLQPGDRCYVSSQEAAAKSTGSLFRHILRQEDIEAPSLLHYGNDLSVDIRPAQRLGIKTLLRDSGNMNRYEEVLESHRWSTEGLGSVMAGASRLARLSTPAESREQAIIRDVAAGVAAPVLTAYILWVLRRANELDVHRLYFLSRDGQQLLNLAQRLAERLEIDCELRYLYVSRRSLNLAAAGGVSHDTKAVVLSHARQASVRELLDRVHLTPEEIADALTDSGLDPGSWDRHLDDEELDHFHDVLENSERCATLVQSRAEASRALVVGYLRQEGFLAPGSVGMVDLGGIGTQLNALASFRERAGEELPTGFLAYREAPEGDPATIADPPVEVLLTDAVTRTGMARFGGMVPFLEIFSAADHGTVRGYDEVAGTIQPRLLASNEPAAQSSGLRCMRETMSSFVEHLILDEDLVDRDADVREGVMEVLRLLVEEPSRNEALVWGSFPFGSDGGHSDNRLASKWTLFDVVGLLRGRSLPGEWYTWRAGSSKMSPSMVRGALRAAYTGRRGLSAGRSLVSRRVAWRR